MLIACFSYLLIYSHTNMGTYYLIVETIFVINISLKKNSSFKLLIHSLKDLKCTCVIYLKEHYCLIHNFSSMTYIVPTF